VLSRRGGGFLSLPAFLLAGKGILLPAALARAHGRARAAVRPRYGGHAPAQARPPTFCLTKIRICFGVPKRSVTIFMRAGGAMRTKEPCELVSGFVLQKRVGKSGRSSKNKLNYGKIFAPLLAVCAGSRIFAVFFMVLDLRLVKDWLS